MYGQFGYQGHPLKMKKGEAMSSIRLEYNGHVHKKLGCLYHTKNVFCFFLISQDLIIGSDHEIFRICVNHQLENIKS